MAVKFPLKMSDGTPVRTMEELREHFDLEAVLGYYGSGRLAEWLEDRYYDEEAGKVRALNVSSKEFNQNLCEILGVDDSEKVDVGLDLGDIIKDNERRECLKKYTTDDRILGSVDSVAFTQSELDDLLKRIDSLETDDDGNKVIYLCGEHFRIPVNVGNIIYRGINNPRVKFDGETVEAGIDLQDIKFDIGGYIEDCSWGMMHEVFENNLSLGLKLLRQEAEQGNADAQFVFGLWCSGDDDIADMTEDEDPVEWWQKAADQGHVEANVFIYQIFLRAALESGVTLGGLDECVKWFQKAVEQNSQYVAMAYGNLGQCYLFGIGVEQDSQEAVRWLKKAVEEDDADAAAQYYLGYCYYFGEGVKQDYEEAVKWFREAAELGDAKAQWRLGVCYEDGKGVEQNYKEAVKWIQKAAEQGNDKAQFSLGACYYYGNGIEENNKAAAEWFRQAAEQDNMNAQIALGILYSYGTADSNFLEAVKWYRRAGAQGDEDSENNLAQCCDDFIESDEDIVKWYRKAAEQNDAEAQCYLGACYENGRGVEVDIEEAKEWYEKAADQGNADAQAGLFRCNNSIFMEQTQEFADMLKSFGRNED